MNDLDSMAYMISNNSNRPENDTSITQYKAVGQAVTPQRKVKSHGKRTVQDIAIEKAALSPWGKEDDYNTKQLSAGKTIKSVEKKPAKIRDDFTEQYSKLSGQRFWRYWKWY